MKINNKGFTLVELLAVMVILISISLVAVGGITESLERTDKKECERQIELAIDAAKIYFSMKGRNPTFGVLIEELKIADYLEKDSNLLNDGYRITLSGSEYLYNGKTVEDACDD